MSSNKPKDCTKNNQETNNIVIKMFESFIASDPYSTIIKPKEIAPSCT